MLRLFTGSTTRSRDKNLAVQANPLSISDAVRLVQARTAILEMNQNSRANGSSSEDSER
jgi:hypothetical protein